MEDSLAGYRKAAGFGSAFRYVERVTSTNDLALEAGLAGAPEGLVIAADEQTSGRGRLGRVWDAPAGTCLLMSLLFRPPEPYATWAPRIPMVCSLALQEAVAACSGLRLSLKWPNDIIYEYPVGGWGKLAGILSEVGFVEGQPTCLVVGIGVNVNVRAADLAGLGPTATSLLALTGRTVPRRALLDEFLTHLDALYAALLRGEDIGRRWRANLAWLGRPVEVITPTAVIHGIAESVASSGALCVRDAKGHTHCFEVGDVSLRPG